MSRSTPLTGTTSRRLGKVRQSLEEGWSPVAGAISLFCCFFRSVGRRERRHHGLFCFVAFWVGRHGRRHHGFCPYERFPVCCSEGTRTSSYENRKPHFLNNNEDPNLSSLPTYVIMGRAKPDGENVIRNPLLRPKMAPSSRMALRRTRVENLPSSRPKGPRISRPCCVLRIKWPSWLSHENAVSVQGAQKN